MRITSAGQVSIPAVVRRRWATSRVRVIDAGDHLVVQPEPDDPFAALRGLFAGLPVSGDEMARRSRRDDDATEARWAPA